MARIPVATDLGRTSARSGRGVARQNTTAEGLGVVSIGRSLEQAGSDFQAVADTMRQRQTTLDIAKAELAKTEGFLSLTNSFDQDTEYGTYGERAATGAQQTVDQAAALIRDPEARELWKTRALADAASTTDSIRDRGFELQVQADKTSFDEVLEANRRLYVAPETPESVRERVRADIEGSIAVAEANGLLTPAEAAARRQTYLEDADYARGLLAVDIDPNAVPSRALPLKAADGVDLTSVDASVLDTFGNLQSVFGRQLSIISGFRDPEHNESVGGASNSQHTHGKAIDIDVSSLSQEERLRLIEAASAQGFTGIGVYDNSIHLDLGAKRAWGPDYHRGSVPAWAEAAIGRHLSGEIERAPPAPTPDWYARLSPEQQAVLHGKQAERRAAIQTAESAQRQVAYAQHKEATELGILTGQVVTEAEILSDPVLDDGDKASMLRTLRSEQGATAEAREYLAGLGLGTAAPLNAYDADARALGEKAFGVLEQSLPEEQREAGAMEFISTSGYVPKAIVADVRQGLGSGDVAQVQASMQRAASLQVMAPNGLRAIENGSDIIKAAEMAQAYTAMGYTPEQAAQKYVAANDPQSIRERDALLKSKPVADAIKNVTTDNIAQMFPGVWVGGYGPGMAVGQNQAQAAAMVSEYKSFYEEAIVDANGDMAVAQELAKNRFTRLYGPSEMTRLGGSAIVRLPPEKTYPALPDGSVGYVREQVEAALREEGVEFSDISLEAYDATDADFRNGAPPRYQVAYLADGQWQLFNLPFVADPAAAMSEYQEARQSQLNEAQTRRETNMQTEIEREQAAGNLPPAEALDQLSQEEWINRNRMLNEVVGGGQ